MTVTLWKSCKPTWGPTTCGRCPPPWPRSVWGWSETLTPARGSGPKGHSRPAHLDTRRPVWPVTAFVLKDHFRPSPSTSLPCRVMDDILDFGLGSEWFKKPCLSLSVVYRLIWGYCNYCIAYLLNLFLCYLVSRFGIKVTSILFYTILFYSTLWETYSHSKCSNVLSPLLSKKAEWGDAVGDFFFVAAVQTIRTGRMLLRMLLPQEMFHHYAVIVAAIMTSADIYRKGCKKGIIFNARKPWIHRASVLTSGSWLADCML